MKERVILFNAKDYIEEELKKIIELDGKVLKNDNRSFVKRVVYLGKEIVVKQPKEKDRRKWIRFTTIFRDSEVVATLISMEKLKEIGVISNEPIGAVEYRKNKMVYKSFAIYTYVEGEKVEKIDYVKVIDLIKKIHMSGYLHGDTQIRNFLKINEDIATIDCNLKKNKTYKFSENMEYFKFMQDAHESSEYISKNIWYYIAKAVFYMIRTKRRVKKYIKVKLRGEKKV